MNDHALMVIRDHLGEVRDSLGQVRPSIPASEIIARAKTGLPKITGT